MGQKDRAVNGGLTSAKASPKSNQIEVSLFGPGYGECALLHIGNENWVIVDSCLNAESQPAALTYLRALGSNPAERVRLIVATHWHDDHIRGMGSLVEVCGNASFCCAAVLCQEEFLTVVGALGGSHVYPTGSGIQEFRKVLSLLEERSTKPVYAIANRRIFNRDGCEVWALSPSDEEFEAFLRDIGHLLPKERETKRRIPSLAPNRVAVVLLIKIDETVILLGSDLERQGWLKILDSYERPNCKASVFKIPHHGSENAHDDRVWNEILHSEPIAALTPWRRGGSALPKMSDVQRIISFTKKAYATASHNDLISKSLPRSRSSAVEKTIREAGATITRAGLSRGVIRLRREFGSQTDWDIETFGTACQLVDYYQS